MNIKENTTVLGLLQFCRSKLIEGAAATHSPSGNTTDISSSPNLDSELILVRALNFLSREELLSKYHANLSDEAIKPCLELLKRRLAGEPIAYIIGYKAFWNNDFFVNEKVLIPRPESELFIEVAIRYFKDKSAPIKILELGTGSGCIILSLLDIFKNSSGIAVDISPEALDVAMVNCSNLKLESRVKFIASDWFTEVPQMKFDIILANPPYIPIDEFHTLSKSVKYYEPQNALTDHRNGFTHYAKIISKAGQFLGHAGIGMLECGYNQARAISEIISQNNLKNLEIISDLAGIERLIVFSN